MVARTSRHDGLVRLVAVFKLLKAALLIVAGVGALKLIHADSNSRLHQWIEALGLHPGSHYVNAALQHVTNLPSKKYKELGIGSFVYAGLFLVEGIGLWMLKRWAEWFTVFITGSLIPFEAYELFRHPTAVKALVLLINIAVVAYLLYRVLHDKPQTQRRRR